VKPGWVVLLLALAFACPSARAQQPNPDVIVRTSLKPESGAVIGQHLALFVDVLFRDGMPRPPRVTIPDLPGAQVFRFETQATTMSDTVDGEGYTGQRFEFAVYPRRGGELVIPPAVVTLLDKAGDETGAAKGEAVRAQISVPAKVDPSQPVIATSRLTLDEQWVPSPNAAFKAGEALVRTITRTAEDVPSLAMRDLAFTAPEGVRVYRDAPQNEDKIDRGVLTGRRVDHVTYVFETAGAFQLPAVSQPWWDLGASRLQAAEGKGISVSVSATPVARPSGTSLWAAAFWREPSNWLKILILLAGIAVGLLGIARGARWSWTAWAERRRRWRQSEAYAFDDLMAVCRNGEVRAIYRAFALWRSRLPTAAAASTAPLATELEGALFGARSNAAKWSRDRSQSFAQKLEESYRSLVQPKVEAGISPLPPLNPALPRAVEHRH
jgi:hypothetical protein